MRPIRSPGGKALFTLGLGLYFAGSILVNGQIEDRGSSFSDADRYINRMIDTHGLYVVVSSLAVFFVVLSILIYIFFSRRT